MTDTAERQAPPEPWPQSWRPLPPPEPRKPWMQPTEPTYTLYLMRDPDTGEPLAEPESLGSCPRPLRGLRCGDCSMIAFAPPPFKATPLGWALATARRAGWRTKWALFGEPHD
jgi:hypothetical protein